MDLASLPDDQLVLRAATLRKYDPDHAWDCINELHQRGSRTTYERAIVMLEDADPAQRAIAADILGQLGTPTYPFRDESVPLLVGKLVRERDTDPLQAVIMALGFLDVPAAVDAIAVFADHPDPPVRLAVARSIRMPSAAVDPPVAVDALLRLSADSDESVRDWATFSLACSDADSNEIRDAFLVRIEDVHTDTRAEALFGLAHRRDPRALIPLTLALASDDAGTLDVESALELADPSLVPHLEALRPWWGGGEDMLEAAIEACRQGTPVGDPTEP